MRLATARQAQELADTKSYAYNEVNWLTNETLADGSGIAYQYDQPTGNRLTKTNGSGTHYPPNYQYDNAGNIISGPSGSYSYDIANRTDQAIVGSTVVTYTYDGDDLRTNKSVNGVANSVVWDVNQAVPQVISDSNYVYIYGLGPIGMIDPAGNAYYFLKDGLGSVTGIVDASGTVTATYDYDAYGNLVSSTGTIANAIRYAGQWYDSETGFYYLSARYYDPTWVLFTQRDTWPGDTASPYSLNPYLYVEDNPADGRP